MNSIIDCPPLYNYCAAKAGALGLMRALRTQMPPLNATVNLIAPWMTGKPQFFKISYIAQATSAQDLSSSMF